MIWVVVIQAMAILLLMVFYWGMEGRLHKAERRLDEPKPKQKEPEIRFDKHERRGDFSVSHYGGGFDYERLYIIKTHEEVLRDILAHLKMKYTETPEVPKVVKLEKIPAKRKK